jgi:hypothetical protein
MPMAESHLFIGDALLHRSRVRRLRFRGLSYEKNGGKGETEAKNANSNHDFLFSSPPTCASAGLLVAGLEGRATNAWTSSRTRQGSMPLSPL